MPGLVYPFLAFSLVYAFLAGVVAWLMLRHIRAVERLVQNLFICASSIAQHAALACFEAASLAPCMTRCY